MILQDFEWFPKGFHRKYDLLRAFKAAIVQINTFANWCFISCFVQLGTRCNVHNIIMLYFFISAKARIDCKTLCWQKAI